MNIIERIRKRHGLSDDTTIGVFRSFTAEVDEAKGKRDIIVTANTDDIDLDKEVVVPAGADTEYFLRNGQIFHNHDYHSPAVATRRKVIKHPHVRDHRAWVVRMHVYNTPRADELLTIAREGGIGASIGFEPVEYGPPTDAETKAYAKNGKSPRSIVRRWKWIELSLTCLPCNVMCQSGEVHVDDSKLAILDSLVTKGRISRASGAAFGLPDAPKRARVVVLGLTG